MTVVSAITEQHECNYSKVLGFVYFYCAWALNRNSFQYIIPKLGAVEIKDFLGSWSLYVL